MRGKRTETYRDGVQERITPADAGKTTLILNVYAAERDHPRGCGENADTLGYDDAKGGSPPRMRGKHGNRQTAES